VSKIGDFMFECIVYFLLASGLFFWVYFLLEVFVGFIKSRRILKELDWNKAWDKGDRW
jgi:hypothetical protein